MIVYEFYLKEAFKAQAFDVLCDSFYKLGNVAAGKRWDNPKDPETGAAVAASAVYAVSRNSATNWVQLLVDDNTPTGIITAIEAKINGLCDTTFTKYSDSKDNIVPMERKRGEIGI
jgi:hypothetical protein